MRLPNEPDPPPQINIVPMIDVIFAILTFFVMSTLFLTRSQGLPVHLPGAATAETQLQEQTVVTIDAQGQLFLNREPTDLDAVEAQVRSQLQQTESVLVVLNADSNVTHGRVVEVMDRLRGVPGVRLAIAAEQPQP